MSRVVIHRHWPLIRRPRLSQLCKGECSDCHHGIAHSDEWRRARRIIQVNVRTLAAVDRKALVLESCHLGKLKEAHANNDKISALRIGRPRLGGLLLAMLVLALFLPAVRLLRLRVAARLGGWLLAFGRLRGGLALGTRLALFTHLARAAGLALVFRRGRRISRRFGRGTPKG